MTLSAVLLANMLSLLLHPVILLLTVHIIHVGRIVIEECIVSQPGGIRCPKFPLTVLLLLRLLQLSDGSIGCCNKLLLLLLLS